MPCFYIIYKNNKLLTKLKINSNVNVYCVGACINFRNINCVYVRERDADEYEGRGAKAGYMESTHHPIFDIVFLSHIHLP